MKKSIERIEGDTDGVVYEIPVYRFAGSDRKADRAYLQAALHAGELPGTVAIHALMPKLKQAEAEGRIRGDITIVPAANPVGRAQYMFAEREGRFHLGTRTNFNRDHFKLDRPDPKLIPDEARLGSVDRRLKARLLKLSLGHQIVLDLHCDDEGVAYFYVPAPLWPAMEDCAAAFGVEAVVLWEPPSDGEFEDAALHPYLASGADLSRIVISTVELRGIADVERGFAEADAKGLYRLLVARGVIEDAKVRAPGRFRGVVAPIANVEMVRTPKSGAVLYEVKPGARVKKGQRLATVVHAAGEDDGIVEIRAPQAGYVMTRRSRRALRTHEDVLKLVGDRPSATARPGALEE
ncbi:MAG: succinylglutamate desuccinylase/aspartoacylase family protein [Rhizobiaceae bacterium]